MAGHLHVHVRMTSSNDSLLSRNTFHPHPILCPLQATLEQTRESEGQMRERLQAVEGQQMGYLVAQLRLRDQQLGEAQHRLQEVKAQLSASRRALESTEAARLASEGELKKLSACQQDLQAMSRLVEEALQLRKAAKERQGTTTLTDSTQVKLVPEGGRGHPAAGRARTPSRGPGGAKHAPGKRMEEHDEGEEGGHFHDFAGHTQQQRPHHHPSHQHHGEDSFTSSSLSTGDLKDGGAGGAGSRGSSPLDSASTRSTPPHHQAGMRVQPVPMSYQESGQIRSTAATAAALESVASALSGYSAEFPAAQGIRFAPEYSEGFQGLHAAGASSSPAQQKQPSWHRRLRT